MAGLEQQKRYSQLMKLLASLQDGNARGAERVLMPYLPTNSVIAATETLILVNIGQYVHGTLAIQNAHTSDIFEV